jgi:hypothetical protein
MALTCPVLFLSDLAYAPNKGYYPLFFHKKELGPAKMIGKE